MIDEKTRCERFRGACAGLALTFVLFGCEGPPDDLIWQGGAALFCPPPNVCGPAPTTLATGVTPTSIVSDGSTLWFTNFSPGTGPKVIRMPAVGGTMTTVVSGSMHSVSIRRSGQRVYWSNFDSDAGVFALPTKTTTPRQVLADMNDQNQTQGLAVARTPNAPSTDVHIYWANATTAHLWDIHQFADPNFPGLLSYSVTSLLPPIDPFDGTNYYPFSVTVDKKRVYFIEDSRTLQSVSRSGGATTRLDDHTEDINALATDGTSLFYVKGGLIKKLPVGGGEATTFSGADGTVTAMTVKDGYLYWTCSTCGTVTKQRIAGGLTVYLANGQTSPACIAVDDTYVYWGTTDALKRVLR
jgi:hypothetical protein